MPTSQTIYAMCGTTYTACQAIWLRPPIHHLAESQFSHTSYLHPDFRQFRLINPCQLH